MRQAKIHSAIDSSRGKFILRVDVRLTTAKYLLCLAYSLLKLRLFLFIEAPLIVFRSRHCSRGRGALSLSVINLILESLSRESLKLSLCLKLSLKLSLILERLSRVSHQLSLSLSLSLNQGEVVS